ncbi:MAG: zinc-ribbon domain-containing protein [Simkaniaceae bacterium]|nr:zinc-ribbon domain-containing protein [Simkaniaceae bacterium]
MRKKLIEENPQLANEWITEKNDRPIEEITAGARYKAWWHCKKCSHNWECPVNARTKGSGCPKCAGRFEICVIDKSPHLAKEWIEEKNDKLIGHMTSGSGYLAWWECSKCTHQWQAIVAKRSKGSGCRPCSYLKKRKRPYIIDAYPDLSEEWMVEKNDRDIEEITAGSVYKAFWKCKTCENEWLAGVQSRVLGTGCPKCAGQHGTPLLEHSPHLAS